MYNTKYKIYYKVLYVKIKNKTNANIINTPTFYVEIICRNLDYIYIFQLYLYICTYNSLKK